MVADSLSTSKILIPYIAHRNINHKYYVQYQLTSGKKIHSLTSSGLYPERKPNDSLSFLKVVEPLLLFDEVYITKDDLIYLYTLINLQLLKDLLKKKIIIPIDTESFRFINNYDPDTSQTVFMTDKGIYGKAGFPERRAIMPPGIKKIFDVSCYQFQNTNSFIEEVISSSNKDLQNQKILELLELDHPKQKIDDVYSNTYKYNRLFYSNYFCSLAANLQIRSLTQDDFLFKLISERVQSLNTEKVDGDVMPAFESIINFENIIDLPSLITQQRLTFSDILKIRNSKDGINFRAWIRQSIRDTSEFNTEEFLSLYHSACFYQNKITRLRETIPYRIIAPIMSLIPGYGIGATIGDTVLSLLGRGWSPRFFIERIRESSKGNALSL
jgi:hypothetical protein